MSKANVLFIHGAGGGGWEWNVWARVFKAHGFAVWAPDLLASPLGLAKTSLEDYSQQVEQHCLQMPNSLPRIIVGASLGGLLGLMNAEQVDALVLINPMPPVPWHSQLPMQEKYPPIIPWQSQTRLHNTRRALPDSDDLACLYAFRHWRNESGAVMNAAIEGVKIQLPDCAIFVLASEKDDDVPCAVSKILADNLNASFIKLPKTSHVGPLLGRNAAQFALQTVGHLNGILQSF